MISSFVDLSFDFIKFDLKRNLKVEREVLSVKEFIEKYVKVAKTAGDDIAFLSIQLRGEERDMKEHLLLVVQRDLG